MPARYSRQQSKTGASIGTIISVPKPSTWTDSSNLNTEGQNWDIESNYPGWIECDGRELQVSQYRALYQILGNRYGGVPNSTFRVPDYRSKKLMGTGVVDGNSPTSPALTPVSAPTGVTPSITEAGTEGGIYTVSTVRQLPPQSEISPSAPVRPDVFFDVDDPVLGVNVTFVTGVAYQTHGTGETEIGGFASPFISNSGRYIGFGTRGTAPFNSLQVAREIRYNNLNLTGYSFVRVYCIAGNDSNGGERINNSGEGLRVIWPNGSESVVLPSAADAGGIEVYDPAYSEWKELQVEIPIQYRTTGVTIRFRQDIDTSSTNNPPGSEQSPSIPIGSHPNSFDCIGIQRIGFLGGEIGGEAIDTFSIGTFRTAGFGQIQAEIIPNFSGNITFSAGSSTGTGTRIVSGAPSHIHDHHHVEISQSIGWIGNPPYLRSEDRNGPEALAVIGALNESVGSVISFDRRGNSILSHSHMIAWGFPGSLQTRGNGTGADNGSGVLVNSVNVGGNTSNTVFSTSSNVGNTISKTLDLVNEVGVSLNPGQITFSETSRLQFDNALDVRLQSAETITLMSPYFRLKYIIKAY